MPAVNTSEVKKSDIVGMIEHHREKKGVLIPLLQEVQDRYGYVPKEAVEIIAAELDVYPVDIYGILTFYAQFHLKPRGRHIIKVCMGTACYIMGGKEILDHLKGTLGIEIDQTTEDGNFTLEVVSCLGCCGMGPVVMVDEKFYGRCDLQKMDEVLQEYGK